MSTIDTRYEDFVGTLADTLCLTGEDREDALNHPYENLLPQVADLVTKVMEIVEAVRVMGGVDGSLWTGPGLLVNDKAATAVFNAAYSGIAYRLTTPPTPQPTEEHADAE